MRVQRAPAGLCTHGSATHRVQARGALRGPRRALCRIGVPRAVRGIPILHRGARSAGGGRFLWCGQVELIHRQPQTVLGGAEEERANFQGADVAAHFLFLNYSQR